MKSKNKTAVLVDVGLRQCPLSLETASPGTSGIITTSDFNVV